MKLSSRASAFCDEGPLSVFHRTPHATRNGPSDEQSRSTKKLSTGVRHKLARPVRAGKKNRLSSPFLSRGFIARAFLKSQYIRPREAPQHPSHPSPPPQIPAKISQMAKVRHLRFETA